MHDAGDSVKSRFFFLAYVAVSFKDYDVAFSFYDSVNENISSDITYECNSPFAYVFVCPRAERNLVSRMKEERVHAVTLYGNGYKLSLGNQFADSLE